MGYPTVLTDDPTTSALTWSEPLIGWAGDPEPWVVTVSDANFFPWIAAFVGSLRDIACFRGQVAVIDYGLTETQRDLLESSCVTLLAPLREQARVIDRYLTIAEYFSDRSDCLVAHFDADIWFGGSLDRLFNHPKLREGRLGAAIDVIPCNYYFECTQPEHHPCVEQLMMDVRNDFGEALQAGVIVGHNNAWSIYAQQLRHLLTAGWIRRPWGSDALALNLFARDLPDSFTLLPITWNAPPLWGIQCSGTDLFVERDNAPPLPIVAVHRTSGVRGHLEWDLPLQSVHPKVAQRWAKQFMVDSLP